MLFSQLKEGLYIFFIDRLSRSSSRVACKKLKGIGSETRGMVREAIPVTSRGLLVLIAWCDIVAVGKSGLIWQTSQIAVDGFSVKTVDGDHITGVSDADWHPAPFSVRLSDGFLLGGNQT